MVDVMVGVDVFGLLKFRLLRFKMKLVLEKVKLVMFWKVVLLERLMFGFDFVYCMDVLLLLGVSVMVIGLNVE